MLVLLGATVSLMFDLTVDQEVASVHCFLPEKPKPKLQVSRMCM